MIGTVMKKLLPGFAALSLILASCASSLRGEELAVEYYNLGNAYCELGRYENGIAFYRKAVSLDRLNRRVRFNLALALLETRQVEEALSELRELAAQDPENLEILGALAYAYSNAGANDEAVSAYHQLLAMAPASADARFNLATILWKTGRLEEALGEFLTLLESYPEDLQALLSAGTLLLELRDYDNAVDVLAEYLQARPEDAAGYLLLARAHRGQERYALALKAYEDSLVHDEDLAEAWFESAEILLTRVEDPDRGIIALEQALAYGFRSQEAIAGLVAAEGLLERDRVLALLAKNGIAPQAEPGPEGEDPARGAEGEAGE